MFVWGVLWGISAARPPWRGRRRYAGGARERGGGRSWQVHGLGR